jgi:hypothetical protein
LLRNNSTVYNEGTKLLEGIVMENNEFTKKIVMPVLAGYGLWFAVNVTASVMSDFIRTRKNNRVDETVKVDVNALCVGVMERLNEAAEDDSIDKQAFLNIFMDEMNWLGTVYSETTTD